MSDPRFDFDFLIGEWTIANRRRELFTGSTEWVEFPSVSVVRPIAGGTGNIEEMEFPTQNRSRAWLRLFDSSIKIWTLTWVDSFAGRLSAPLVGRFTDGKGSFSGNQSPISVSSLQAPEGLPSSQASVRPKLPLDAERPPSYLVQVNWSQVTPDSAHWEQHWSADGGNSWETDWVMEYTRTA